MEREAATGGLPLFLSLVRSLVEQGESPQRHAGRLVLEIGVAAALRIDAAEAAHHRDILLAVLFPCYRLADDAGRRLEAPQDLPGVGIERLELTGHDAGEHEVARRHHGR